MRSFARLVSLVALTPAIAYSQRAAATVSSKQPSTFSLVWRPVRDGTLDITAIEVSEVLASPTNRLAFSLRAPVTYAGVRGIADRVERLIVRDSAGDVPLTVEDEPPHPGGFPNFRHWRAGRAVRGPVAISYRSLVQRPPAPGPPFGIRAAAGGVSGAGSGFLVLPEGQPAVRSHVHWDLGDLGEGSTAVTTFGEGDFDLAGEPEELLQGWIMAGPLGVFRGEGAANGFSAAWLGAPAFDAAAEMEWAARMYAYLGKAYQYLNPPPPYRVFIRVLPDARGATALANSFMLVASPAGANAAPAASPRETMTHEMGHMWVGGVEGPLGVTSWFSEGLNTYYTRLLPMRGGFDSVSAYGRRVNADFRDYYTNVARNLSADSIVAIGFNDENVRHIPYARGSFYFADLDSKIRAASHGRRNLDTLMLDVFRRRARGERFDHEAWIAAVTREIGPTARSDFERVILNGGTIVPASDAFGPCFVRRAAQLTSRAGQPKVNGYEWIRVDSIPDTRCRVW